MVAIRECGIITQVMTRSELERLVLIVADIVTLIGPWSGTIELGLMVTTPYPVHRFKFAGAVLIVTGVVDIELHITHIIQAVFVIGLAEQLILNVELRGQVVLLLVPPCLFGTSHGITIHKHVLEIPGCLPVLVGTVFPLAGTTRAINGSQRQHVEVIIRRNKATGHRVLSVLIDTHVWHSIVCTRQDVVSVVLMVGRKGQVDIAGELNAVADPIVQSGRTREAVELLSDDRACALIVVGTDTEGCLITTTGKVKGEPVLLTELLYLLHPIGVMVVMVIYIRFVFHIIQLPQLCGPMVRIVVGLLKHHGVTITIQHLVASGLPGTFELVGEVDAGGTTVATACLDFDDTIGTVSTPLGSTCCILQDRDALNVIRIHLKQCGELLLVVHVREVISVFLIIRDFKDMVIEDNQRLCIAVDGGSTTKTHGGTRTKVTRVWHNIETGNLTLQGLIDRLEGETFHVVHTELLDGTRILTLWNLKTCGRRIFLTFNRHLGNGLGVVLQSYLEDTLATAYLLAELLVTDIGNFQSIVGILDIHGEVTIHISNSLTDNTIVLIYLLDVGTYDDVNIIRNGTGDTPLLCACG